MTTVAPRSAVSEISPNDGAIRKEWLQSLTGFQLRQVYNIFASDFRAGMKDLGLRPVQLSILSIVDENPGIRQGKIGEALNIARENVAPLVSELKKTGHLKRQRHPTDGRAFAIYLTPAGHSILLKSKKIICERDKVMLAQLTPNERGQFVDLLRKLIKTTKP